MSEFERLWLLNTKSSSSQESLNKYPNSSSPPVYINPEILTKSIFNKANPDLPDLGLPNPEKMVVRGDFVTETLNVKLELLEQLIQELRTPLTSILGMATVLSREIYGPLMTKQKEYLEIVQKSGRYLLSLVNEISELGTITSKIENLDLTAVDIEMLCQQVTHSLEDGAKRKEQQIRISIERDRARTWVIDKEKVRQLLYHLLFSVIQSATTSSIIRVHVFSSTDSKKIAVSVTHPWLGDGLTDIEPIFTRLPALNNSQVASIDNAVAIHELGRTNLLPSSSQYKDFVVPTDIDSLDEEVVGKSDRQIKPLYSLSDLRLCLACYLAQQHNGEISIELTPEAGYRYLLSLPNLEPLKNNS